MSTHYDLLGLPRGADQQEIKKAYHRLAMKHHPDKNASANYQNATAAFQNIQAAYEVLSDPHKRRGYDATLYPIPTANPVPTPYTPSQTNPHKEKKLDPQHLPQDLVDILDSDAPALFSPYLNKYSEKQLRAVLIRSCFMGKHQIPEVILNRHPKLSNIAIHDFRIRGNLLFLAAASGNIHLVRLLIEKGTSVDWEGGNDGIDYILPVYMAVAGKHLEVVREFRAPTSKNINPHRFGKMFDLTLIQEDPQMVDELLQWGVPRNEYDWLRALMKKQSLPLVHPVIKYFVRNSKDEWVTLPTLVVPHFGLDRIKELVASRELDPFAIMWQGESSKDAIMRLFKALGRSCDFERVQWFRKQFEQVQNGMQDPSLLNELFLGAIELHLPSHICSDLAPFLGPLQSTSSRLPEFASSSLHKIS